MTTSGLYWGQPGHEDDDPQVDKSMLALHNAFSALSTAALFADDADLAFKVDEALGSAAMTAFGFEPDSDEAKGLHLLIGAIRRAAVTS